MANPLKKNPVRTGAKLSLSKKSKQKENSDKDKEKAKKILLSDVDLNETSQFREPMRNCAGKKGRNLSSRSQCDNETVEPSKDPKATWSHETAGTEEQRDDAACHLCHKNITRLNPQRRLQHVNRCMDKEEEEKRRQQLKGEALESARTSVLNCPMCGRHFKVESARVSHLKKCGQSLGVATDQMLKLVKDQETERQVMVAAGVVPTTVSNARHKSSSNNNPKKRKAREPKSKFEEDVQVAMAMSSSLVEQQNPDFPDLIGHRQGNKGAGGNRKSKTKKVLEDACLLTTLSAGDKRRRLEASVNNIVLSEHADSPMSSPPKLFETELHSGGSTPHLWGRSRVATEAGEFYVKALMPPLEVCAVTVGRKVRRMSSIPGRDTSFVRRNSNTPAECAVDCSVTADDLMTASTQTAVVLAELAVTDPDVMDASLPSSTPQDSSQLVEGCEGEGGDTSQLADCSPTNLNASGFCVVQFQFTGEEQVRELGSLAAEFGSLVNNALYSDVQIRTNDGQTIHAHKNILAARCPRLLKMEEEGQLNLPISHDSAVCLLTYIYTGRFSITATDRTELLQLAVTLEWHDLETKVRNLVSVGETADDPTDRPIDEPDDLAESKLDLVLKDVWGESDSDLDPEDSSNHDLAKDSNSNFGDKAGSEISKQDYYEILCTQRRKLSETNDDDTSNTEAGKKDDTEASCEADDESSDEKSDVNHAALQTDAEDNSGDAQHDLLGENKEVEMETDAVLDAVECEVNGSGESPVVEDGSRQYTDEYDDEHSDCVIVNGVQSPPQKRIKWDDGAHVTSVEKHVVDSEKFYHRTRNKTVNVEIDEDKYVNAGEHNLVPNTVDSDVGVSSDHSHVHEETHLENHDSVNNSHKLSDQDNSHSVCSSASSERSGSRHDTSNMDLFESPILDSTVSVHKIKDAFSTQISVDENNVDQKEETKPRKAYTFKPSRKVTETDQAMTKQTEVGELKLLTNNQDNSAGLSTENVFLKSENYVENENDLESVDSDVEITGDNFAEISSHSPAFHSNKSKLSLAKRMSFGDKHLSTVDSDNANVSQESNNVFNGSDGDVSLNQSITEYFNDSFSEVKNTSVELKKQEIEEPYCETFEVKSDEDLVADRSTSPVIGYKHVRNGMPTEVTTSANKDSDVEFSSAEDEVELMSTVTSSDGDLSANEDVDTYHDIGDDDMESGTAYVWNDFDDCGVGFVGMSPNDTQRRSPPSKTDVSSTSDDCTTLTSGTEISPQSEKHIQPQRSKYLDVLDTDNKQLDDVDTDSKLLDDLDTDNKLLDNLDTDNKLLDNLDTDNKLLYDINKLLDDVDTDNKLLDDLHTDKHSDDSDTDDKQLDDGDDSFIMKVDDCNTNMSRPSVVPAPVAPQQSRNFKTPSAARPRTTKKPWVPPSPFTPMPEFERMNTPGLKREMQRYGVKPVGKKRMVKVLKDIYHQTHQYETDSDVDDDLGDDPASSPNREENGQRGTVSGSNLDRKTKYGATRDKQANRQPDILSNGVSDKGRKDKTRGKTVNGQSAIIPSAASDNGRRGKAKQAVLGEDCEVLNPARHSINTDTSRQFKHPNGGKSVTSGLTTDVDVDNCSVTSSQGDTSSQESDISILLEESCLHAPSDDSDVSTSPQKQKDVTQKLLSFMRKKSDLNTRILTYDPLELDILKQDIKEAGIKCSAAKLIEFLDEQCIAFTTKNDRKRKPARRRARTAKASSKSQA